MWAVPGETVDVERFEPFQPTEILDHYDGPRIFTFTNRSQERHLAFWCDEDGALQRYLVVPCGDVVKDKLTSGRISMREALDQPWLWVVDVEHTGRLSGAWRSTLKRLPQDVLPEPGTMLWPTLERPSPSSWG